MPVSGFFFILAAEQQFDQIEECVGEQETADQVADHLLPVEDEEENSEYQID